jgi:uncharacterized protein
MTKFLADRMLGKLVKGLRMLGYDTVYFRGEDPHELLRLAHQESRVILTRSTKLAPGRPEETIIKVAEDNPWLQLRSLIQEGWVSLTKETLFSRCLLCNGFLREIPKEEAEGKVPDFIFYHQDQFVQCPQCSRIYWRGSHHQKMERRLKELFQPS